jgi:hypothetical protein
MNKTKYQETLIKNFPVAERRMQASFCVQKYGVQDNLQHPVQQAKKMTDSHWFDNFMTSK